MAERSHDAAAMIMQVSASTVNGYLVEARKEIFRQLRKRYIQLPSWLTTPDVVFHESVAKVREPRMGHIGRGSDISVQMKVDFSQYDLARPFSSVVDISIRLGILSTDRAGIGQIVTASPTGNPLGSVS